jgi:DNA-binding GntR family transcriptional regulator
VSTVPSPYLVIAAQLRERIEVGTYSPGSVLPSNRQLRAEFGVADGTIRRALAELDRLGLTVARQGRPRMVAVPGQEPVGTLYERVEQGIRRAIADGRHGSVLPSESELAAEYNVGRKTVRQALAELERRGEIVNRRGRRRQVPGAQQPQDALYEKVVARLMDEIAKGIYQPGTVVPTEDDLRIQYKVSRATIRKALGELRRRGVVTYEEGRARPSWATV